jgi:hypothetical protein
MFDLLNNPPGCCSIQLTLGRTYIRVTTEPVNTLSGTDLPRAIVVILITSHSHYQTRPPRR